jgi:hypothetical protein
LVRCKKEAGPGTVFRALRFWSRQLLPAAEGGAYFFLAALSFLGFLTSFLSRLLPLPMTSSLCQPRAALIT